jgi:hypothetical protein
MPPRAAALLLSLAAVAARAQAPPAPETAPRLAVPGVAPTPAPPSPSRAAPAAKEPRPAGTTLEEVSGTVKEVDRTAHRLTVDTGSERVTLSLDRNTMVYTPAGLGTVLDVTPGAEIRAGRNAEFLAYWVQVRGSPKPQPPSAPGQGTGPGGGSGAAATEAGGPASAPPPGSGGTLPTTPGPVGGTPPR